MKSLIFVVLIFFSGFSYSKDYEVFIKSNSARFIPHALVRVKGNTFVWMKNNQLNKGQSVNLIVVKPIIECALDRISGFILSNFPILHGVVEDHFLIQNHQCFSVAYSRFYTSDGTVILQGTINGLQVRIESR